MIDQKLAISYQLPVENIALQKLYSYSELCYSSTHGHLVTCIVLRRLSGKSSILYQKYTLHNAKHPRFHRCRTF